MPAWPTGAFFLKLCAVEELEKKVSHAVKAKKLHSLTLLEQIDEAEQAGILNADQAQQLKETEQASQEIIAVDDFADEDLRRQPTLLQRPHQA